MDDLNMKELIKQNRINESQYIRLFALVVLIIVFTSMNKNLVSTMNISNILGDIAPLLLLSTGVTLILIIGSMDLSIGSICSFSVVLIATILPSFGWWSFVVAILYGLGAGWLNGFLYVKLKVPSFIITLGMMGFWQSMAYLLASGAPLQIYPAQYMFIDWARIKLGVVSLPFIIAIVVMLAFYIMQKKTKLGKYTYAIGANERAASLAGINVNKTKMIVFMLSGLGSVMCGIVLGARLKSGIPNLGEPFTLLVYASVALGGTPLTGGRGSVIGSLIGVAFITIINNGMNVIGVNAFWQSIVSGIIIILAIYTTVDRKNKSVIIK